MGKKITKLCQQTDREILLFVDEVDKSSDNQIFLNFLGMLRNKYLRREEGLDDTFKSVILAGVYDVKNLKLMLRPEEEKKYNSPWNVAVDFNIDMSFSPEEIALAETATAATESIQRETGEEGFSLEKILTDTESEEKMVEKIALRQAIEALPERERMVVQLRYFHSLTQQRVAKVMNVSQVQVSRIEKKAIAMLRELMM